MAKGPRFGPLAIKVYQNNYIQPLFYIQVDTSYFIKKWTLRKKKMLQMGPWSN